jgi:hypothetical protein
MRRTTGYRNDRRRKRSARIFEKMLTRRLDAGTRQVPGIRLRESDSGRLRESDLAGRCGRGSLHFWGLGVFTIFKVARNLAKNPLPGSNGRLYKFQ